MGALGDFYLHQHRNLDGRTHYQALASLWQNFPGSNSYVDRQRAGSKRLLAAAQ
jgi:hypothetical protein